MLQAELNYYLTVRDMFLSEEYSLDDVISTIDDMGADFIYNRLNIVACSQANPYTLFQEVLAQVNSTKQFLKLHYLARHLNISYTWDLVELVRDKNPEHGLRYLTRLFGGVHLRDVKYTEHIIHTVVKLRWQEGLDYLLKEDPSLVNVGILNLDLARNKILNVDFLLNYAMSISCDKSIIQSLINANPDIHLKNKNARTQIYYLANNQEKCQRYPEVLDWIFSQIDIEALGAGDEFGVTCVYLAHSHKNEIFLGHCKQKYADANRVFNINDFKANTSNPYKVPSETQKSILAYRFRGYRPVLCTFEMFSTLIGKGNNVKLFFNTGHLITYAKFLIAQGRSDFMVNSILMVYGGGHAINVVLTRKNNGRVKALMIDGTAGEHALGARGQLELAGIECLGTVEKFQHTDTGCHIIACYLSGKLAHLTLDEVEKLHQDFGRTQNGRIRLHDLPLKFGVLGVCQSLSTIDKAYDARTSSHPEEASEPVNRKRSETFKSFVERNKVTEFPGFVDVDSRKINNTVAHKTKNRYEHALKFAELDKDRQVEAIANLLCFNELDLNWRVNTQELLNRSPDFVVCNQSDWSRRNVKQPELY